MRRASLYRSRFDAQEDEPLGPLANLVDIMLVFACGLIAALAAASGGLDEHLKSGGVKLEQGRELPEVPRGIGQSGAGVEPLGRVYRDPESGKLILIGEDNGPR